MKKNMFKKVLGVVLTTSVLFAMVGCSPEKKQASGTDAKEEVGKEESGDDVLEIALITKMVDSPYWQTVKNSAIKKAEELGNVKITHLGPPTEADINTQVSIVETCIADGYDGIILAACDKDSLVDPVKKATEAGIPVVMIDSGIAEPVYDAFLATNNVAAGAACADMTAEFIGEEGKIGIINFSAGTSTAVDRETGFVERIAEAYPNIEIVGIQYCDSDPVKAANQTTDMISADDEIKAIWGANDQSVVGIVTAIEGLGRDDIIITALGNSDPSLIDGLYSGAISGTAAQMPKLMATEGVQTVIDIINGNAPAEKDIDTGVLVITEDNIDSEEAKDALTE